MAYSHSGPPDRTVLFRARPCARKGSTTMKLLKAQALRVLLVLSAIASSALVLEAGQRWH